VSHELKESAGCRRRSIEELRSIDWGLEAKELSRWRSRSPGFKTQKSHCASRSIQQVLFVNLR